MDLPVSLELQSASWERLAPRQLLLCFRAVNPLGIVAPSSRLRVCAVSVRRTEFELPTLQATELRYVTVTVSCENLGSVPVSQLPTEVLVYHAEAPEDAAEFLSFGLSMDLFSSRLNIFTPIWERDDVASPEQSRYNVLVFGLAGSGKVFLTRGNSPVQQRSLTTAQSSFVNTVLTMLSHSSEIHNLAQQGGGIRHSTTRLSRYLLTGLQAALWDTWGLTRANREEHRDQLRLLLGGCLPSGWSMHDALSHDHKAMMREHSESQFVRRIHSVLFFVPLALLRSPALAHELQQSVELAHQIQSQGSEADKEDGNIDGARFDILLGLACSSLGYRPIICISKPDEVIGALRDNPLDDDLFQEDKSLAESVFQHPEAARPPTVLPVINYFGEDRRAFRIEAGILRILESALKEASVFMRAHRRTLYQAV